MIVRQGAFEFDSVLYEELNGSEDAVEVTLYDFELSPGKDNDENFSYEEDYEDDEFEDDDDFEEDEELFPEEPSDDDLYDEDFDFDEDDDDLFEDDEEVPYN